MQNDLYMKILQVVINNNPPTKENKILAFTVDLLENFSWIVNFFFFQKSNIICKNVNILMFYSEHENIFRS